MRRIPALAALVVGLIAGPVAAQQPTAIDQASGYLEALSRRWDQALGRLQKFVED